MKASTQHTQAVLLMAYGTPDKPEDVAAYYTDVRRGSPPSAEQLKELQDRYNAIGGTTPLSTITREQAQQLEKRVRIPVFVGMKHWHPYIPETVARMAELGIEDIVALVLAPQYSMMSIGDYKNRLNKAITEIAPHMHVTFIERWGNNPVFINSLTQRIEETRKKFPAADFSNIEVMFTAHSLPTKILEAGDPYQEELLHTCTLAAEALKLPHWRMAFQSAGRTRDTWLGPDILTELHTLAEAQVSQVLVAPIGFTTDNLEILYDLDIQAAEAAQTLGITFRRIPSANATPRFIDALENVITPFISPTQE